MMKINVILKIVWLIVSVLWFFGIANLTLAENAVPSCDMLISDEMGGSGMDLSSPAKNGIYSVKLLTQKFCESVSQLKCSHDDDLFDANQSVFLTLLCENVDKGDLYTKIDRDVLLKTGFTQFGISDYGFLDTEHGTSINFCSASESDMNGCDYWKQLPKMFIRI